MRDALGTALHTGRTFSLRGGQGGNIGRVILLGIGAWLAWAFTVGTIYPMLLYVTPWVNPTLNEVQQYGFYLIGGYILIRTGRVLYLRTFGKLPAEGKRQRTERPKLEWRFMGSATFAYDAELERAGFYEPAESGLMLGRFHRWHDRGSASDDLSGDVLWYNGDKHGLTIAPTRGGKGESFIIPAALTYGGSLFVIDPKGQCAAVTARHRATPILDGGMGQKVYILNPWNLHDPIMNDPVRNPLVRSAHFNPMDALVGADDAELLDGAMLLAEALVPKDEGESKPFFPLSARDLVTALIMYVASSAAEKTLREVRRTLTDPSALDDALTDIMRFGPYSLVRQKAARFAELVEGEDGETRYRYWQQESAQDVLATAIVNTSLLDSPTLAATMGDSDFSFEELKSSTEPITVYLVIPASRIETYNRWLRLLVSVALRSLIDAKDKPKVPALFILDEFYQLGALQKIQDAMSLMAGYGVKLWPIIQDLNQLRARYGDRLWETFISNAGCIQLFKPNDNFTAEYFSTRMGDMTDWGFSTNEGYNSGGSTSTTMDGINSSSTSGTNKAHSEAFTLTPHKRRLRNPDELTRMDRSHSFLFVDGAEIIPGERIRYHTAPWLVASADADPEFYGLQKAIEMNASPAAMR